MKKFLILISLISTFTYSQVGMLSRQQKLRESDRVIVNPPQPSVSIPVVIILGQSNADGGAFNADFSTEINTFYSTEHTNLKIYYKPAIRNDGNGIGVEASTLLDDGEWWQLTNGHDAINKKTLNSIGMPASTVAIQSTQTHGPEAAMGKWWEENYTGQELRIIKFGVGGSSLQGNWLGAGKLYDIFMQYVYNPAIENIIADGNTVNLIGVYWNQGESDTNTTMSVNYEANLNTLISDFRTDTGFTNARWVIGQLSDYTNTVDFNNVKNAQAAVAAADVNVDLIITDGTGSLPLIEKNPSDAIHYSSNGQTQLAEAFWNIIYPNNTYTIAEQKTVSIGVEDINNNLLKTLTMLDVQPAGTYTPPIWNGLNEEGEDVSAQGHHYRVVANDIQYNWEGSIGNSSKNETGATKINHYGYYRDAVIIDDGIRPFVIFGHGYDEKHSPISKMFLDDLNVELGLQTKYVGNTPETGAIKPIVAMVAYDGVNLYMGSKDLGNQAGVNQCFISACALDGLASYTNFLPFQGETTSVFGQSTIPALDLMYTAGFDSDITGLAVQTGNENLIAARQGLDTLKVYHKTTGVTKQIYNTWLEPKLCEIDTNGFLWFVHGDTTETIEKFTIDNVTGAITTTGFTIAGFENIRGLTVSPDGTEVVAQCEVYNGAHQVKSYNTTTGALAWTLGRNESYATDATVYDDKFYFRTNKDIRDIFLQFVAYDPSGNLWVNEQGNKRIQIFNPTRTSVLDKIQVLPATYSTSGVANDVTNSRLLVGAYEFEIDLDLPIVGGNTNNMWRLTKNWGSSEKLYDIYGSPNFGFRDATILSNGKTYAQYIAINNDFHVMELEAGGTVKSVFREGGKNPNQTLLPNGDILSSNLQNNSGVFTETINKYTLTGFDENNDPVYSVLEQIGSYTAKFELNQGGYPSVSRGFLENGRYLIFNGDDKNDWNNPKPIGFDGLWHIGSIEMGMNADYSFKAAPGYVRVGNDIYYKDGTFDDRNVEYAGGATKIMGDMFAFNYKGEFWNGSQTNYHHIYDQWGLPLTIFGTDGKIAEIEYIAEWGWLGGGPGFDRESPAGFHGNNLSFGKIEHNGDWYIFDNDEFQHGGAGVWSLKNMASKETFILDINTDTNLPDTTGPYQPSNLAFSNITTTTVDLSWTASTDVNGISDYKIYSNATLLATVGSNATTFTLTGLTPNTIYDLNVRGVDPSGNESIYSNVRRITTLP